MALTINHQTNDISATSGSVTIDGASAGASAAVGSFNVGANNSSASSISTGIANAKLLAVAFKQSNGSNGEAFTATANSSGVASITVVTTSSGNISEVAATVKWIAVG